MQVPFTQCISVVKRSDDYASGISREWTQIAVTWKYSIVSAEATTVNASANTNFLRIGSCQFSDLVEQQECNGRVGLSQDTSVGNIVLERSSGPLA